MRTLSKSKLLAFRQCPKRLWLEFHRPELRQDSTVPEASFSVGHQVGDIARQIYDPENQGQLIDVQNEGFDAAFARSAALLTSSQPVFEAAFSAGGALAFADIMLPVHPEGMLSWRMIEVKSSTGVKSYHRDDAAIQAFVAKSSGVPLISVSVAHIDSDWVYPGGGDYQGLLRESDLTEHTFSRESEVRTWIAEAQAIDDNPSEPEMGTGSHCDAPYECGFFSQIPPAKPVA